MLQLSITRADAVLVDAILRDDLHPAERVGRLPAGVREPARDRLEWLAQITLDDDRRWASTWLRAVALQAELVSNPALAAGHARVIDQAGDVPATPAGRALAEVVLAASASPDALSSV